jgi:dTMP kinase
VPPPTSIAVVGIDGSGKTTQAKHLVDWLRAEGTPARYFENPGGRPVTDWLARRLGRADTAALLGERGRLLVETSIRAIALGRVAGWSRATGEIAVMDRCAACQLALVGARGVRGERAVRAVLGPFGLPDLVLQLVVDGAMACDRVEQRGYDRETVDYLERFAAAYRGLPEAATFVLVDGNGSVDEVQDRLRTEILLRYPGLVASVDGGRREAA